MDASPPIDRAAALRPAVLAPVSIADAASDQSDIGSAAIDSIAAAGAGATGIDLTIPGPAVAHAVSIADELGDLVGLPIFIRSDAPLSPGRHQRIVLAMPTPTHRPGASVVVDLGLDRLGVGPDAEELAARWSSERGTTATPFMISTVGFRGISDAEVMALTAVAVLRGAAAITSDRPKVVRRVVDTVAAVVAAGSAA